ncbi:MAG: hypothetical protein D6746_10450 [Bacteroidetes bacterium]|nr:MAG: hypothetical protein D6746_10450 [Bacteroidota bacterium]
METIEIKGLDKVKVCLDSIEAVRQQYERHALYSLWSKHRLQWDEPLRYSIMEAIKKEAKVPDEVQPRDPSRYLHFKLGRAKILFNGTTVKRGGDTLYVAPYSQEWRVAQLAHFIWWSGIEPIKARRLVVMEQPKEAPPLGAVIHHRNSYLIPLERFKKAKRVMIVECADAPYLFWARNLLCLEVEVPPICHEMARVVPRSDKLLTIGRTNCYILPYALSAPVDSCVYSIFNLNRKLNEQTVIRYFDRRRLGVGRTG